MSLVRCLRISKDFPSGDTVQHVLRNITVDIDAGKMTMLVGPSGSGKTTLLSIISGILTPTSGEVHINGTDITHLSDHEKVLFRRKSIGFVFQQFNLLPSLTAIENASLTLLADGLTETEAQRQAQEWLEHLGMEDHLYKYPRQLSGGQQQRVAFARALAHRPALVICDEPTSSLDEETGQIVMKLLKDIAVRPQSGVLVVTHDTRIFPYAQKILRIEKGQILEDQSFSPSSLPSGAL